MRAMMGFAAVVIAAGLYASGPAEAKTCKDVVSAHARSSAQVSDATREKRANDKAISNWGKRAADTYGWSLPLLVSRRGEEGRVQGHGEIQDLHGCRQALHRLLTRTARAPRITPR